VKALCRIVNELRRDRGMPPFEETSDIRDIVSVIISRVKNVQCQIRFHKKSTRRPHKAYYYMIDAGYFDDMDCLDTSPARDARGNLVSGIKVLRTIDDSSDREDTE
jgi:hypothetical protein